MQRQILTFLCLLFISSIFANPSPVKISDPINDISIAEFSKKMVDAIKTKNHEAFKKLLVTPEEYKTSLISIGLGASKKIRNKKIKEYETKYPLLIDKLKFDSLITEIETKGIDLASIAFISDNYFTSPIDPKKPNDILFGSTGISCSSDALFFDLNTSVIMRISMQWRLTNFPQFKPGIKREQTPDEFGKKMIDAIKTNNYESFKTIMLTSSEYTDLVMESNRTEESKIEKIQSFEKYNSGNRSKEEFDKFIKRFTDESIDVSKIIYTSTEINTEKDFGITIGSFKTKFSSGETEFELRSSEITKTKTGWKITRFPYLKKGSERDSTCVTFAKTILKTLEKNSLEEYKKLVVTDEELRTLVKSSSLTDSEKKRFEEKIIEESPSIGTIKYYESVMGEIKEYKIILSEITDVTYEYQKKSEKGASSARIYIKFKHNENKFEMRCRDNIKTQSGWRLAGKIRIDWLNQPINSTRTELPNGSEIEER